MANGNGNKKNPFLEAEVKEGKSKNGQENPFAKVDIKKKDQSEPTSQTSGKQQKSSGRQLSDGLSDITGQESGLPTDRELMGQDQQTQKSDQFPTVEDIAGRELPDQKQEGAAQTAGDTRTERRERQEAQEVAERDVQGDYNVSPVEDFNIEVDPEQNQVKVNGEVNENLSKGLQEAVNRIDSQDFSVDMERPEETGEVSGQVQEQVAQAKDERKEQVKQRLMQNIERIGSAQDPLVGEPKPKEVEQQVTQAIENTPMEDIDFDIQSKANNTENPDTKQVLNDFYKSLQSGSARIGEGMARTPSFVYDSYAMLNNAISDATGLEGFAMEYSPDWLKNNAIAEYYDESQKRLRESMTQYDKGINASIMSGDYGKALHQASMAMGESLPYTIGMMAAGAGGASASRVIPFTTGVFGSVKKAELDEKHQKALQTYGGKKSLQDIAKMDETTRTFNALLTGAAEGTMESLGSVKIGEGIMKKFGEKKGKEILQKGFKASALNAMKKLGFVGGSSFREGATESGTQYANNITARITGEDPDRNPFKGVGDAFTIGATMGLGMSGVGQTVADIVNKESKEKKATIDGEEVSFDEVASRLEDPNFVKDVKDEKVDLKVNNPNPALDQKLQNSFDPTQDNLKPATEIVENESEETIKIDGQETTKETLRESMKDPDFVEAVQNGIKDVEVKSKDKNFVNEISQTFETANQQEQTEPVTETPVELSSEEQKVAEDVGQDSEVADAEIGQREELISRKYNVDPERATAIAQKAFREQTETQQEELSPTQQRLKELNVPKKIRDAIPEGTELRESFLADNKNIVRSLLGLQGQYNEQTGEIKVGKLYSSLFDGREKVTLHEATHAATVQTLRDVLNNEEKYSQSQIDSARELNDLAFDYTMNVSEGARMAFPKLYGTQSPSEFIAEFVSNPKFREFVGETHPEQKVGIIDTIWRNILKLLGAKESQINEERVNRVQELIDSLLETGRERVSREQTTGGQDAVQEQQTEEVDVRQQAGDGETVVEGGEAQQQQAQAQEETQEAEVALPEQTESLINKPERTQQENDQLAEDLAGQENLIVREGQVGEETAFFAEPQSGSEFYKDAVEKLGTDENTSVYRVPDDFQVKDLSNTTFDDYKGSEQEQQAKDEGFDAVRVMEADGSTVLDVFNTEKLQKASEGLPELRQETQAETEQVQQQTEQQADTQEQTEQAQTIDTGEEVVFDAPRSKYSLVREQGGALAVKDQQGNRADNATKKRIVGQYIDETDLSGATAAQNSGDVTIDDVSPEVANDFGAYVAEFSQDPYEIASAIQNEPKYVPENQVDARKRAIAESLGQNEVNRGSFVDFADEGKIAPGLAKTYFAQGRDAGRKIDDIAQSATMYLTEDFNVGDAEITTDEVVEYIIDNPNDPDGIYKQKSETYQNLVEAFVNVTGLDANPSTIEKIASYGRRQFQTPERTTREVEEGTGTTEETVEGEVQQEAYEQEQEEREEVGRQEQQDIDEKDALAKELGFENIHNAVNSVNKNLDKDVTPQSVTEEDMRQAAEQSETATPDFSEKARELSNSLKGKESLTGIRNWMFKQFSPNKSQLTQNEQDQLKSQYADKYKKAERKHKKLVEQQEAELEKELNSGLRRSKQQNLKGRRILNNVVNRLKKSFPNINVQVLSNAEFAEKFKNRSGTPIYENNQGVYGFFDYYSGEVYLNEMVSDETVALEEFAHLWLALLKHGNPTVYNAGVKLAKDSDVFSDLADVYEDLSSDQIAEEVIAHQISEEGVNILAKEIPVKNFIKRFWEGVKNMLSKVGIKKDLNVAKLTLDKLSKHAAKEITRFTPVTSLTSEGVANITSPQKGGFRFDDYIRNSILRPNKSFYKDKIIPFAKEHFTSLYERGEGFLVQAFSERISGRQKKIEREANQRIAFPQAAFKRHLDSMDVMDKGLNLESESKKERKAEYGTQVLNHIQRAINREVPLEEIRQYSDELYNEVAQVRKELDNLTKQLIQQRVLMEDDVIVGVNEDLEIYLSTNFKTLNDLQEKISNRDKAKDDYLKKVSKMDESELSQEKEKLGKSIKNTQDDLKKKKLERLEGMIQNVRRQKERIQSPELRKQLNEMYKRLQKMEPQENQNESQFKSKYKGLNKQIEKAKEELQALYNQEREPTAEEAALFEELTSVQEMLEEGEGIGEGKSLQEKRVEIQKLADRDIRLKNKLDEHNKKDLAVEEVEYKVVDEENGLVDVNFLHVNGKQTEFSSVDQNALKVLFGDSVSRKMLREKEGVHEISDPKVLQNNSLYETMMDRLGKYTHRSYMVHEYADFAEDPTKYISQEHYNEGYNHVKRTIESGKISKVSVETTKDGKYAVTFENEIGIKSHKGEPTYYDNLDNLKEENNGPLPEKEVEDIKTQLKQSKKIEDFKLSEKTKQQSIIAFPADEVQVDDFIREILSKQGLEKMFKGVPVKGLDTNVFKQRKDIDEPIRKLMGEHTNPFVNMYKTLVNSSIALENNKLVNEILAQDNLLVSIGKPTDQHTQKVTKSELFALGDREIYMRPETYEAFFGKEKAEHYGLTHFLMWGSAYTKLAFTAASPGTQARNFFGGGLMYFASGHANFSNMRYAMALVSQDFSQSDSKFKKFMRNFGNAMSAPLFILRLATGKSFGTKGKGGRGRYSKKSLQEASNKLVEYNIVGENLEAGIISELLDAGRPGHSFNELYGRKDFLNKLEKGKELSRESVDEFSKTYRYGDELFKTMQWLDEKKVHEEAYPEKSEEEINEMVADKVRNHQPTYSRVWRGVQNLSKFPLLGTFVQFHFERYRNMPHIFKDAYKELRSDRKPLQKQGAKRIAAATTSLVWEAALAQTMQYIFGWDDDEDDAVSEASPDFAKNSQRVYVNDNKKQPTFIDLTYVNPNSQFGLVATAISNEHTTKEKAYEAINEIAGPAGEVGIFTQKLWEAIEGYDSYGTPVYSRSSSLTEQIFWGTEHVMGEVKPKFVEKPIGELIKAGMGKQAGAGKEYKALNSVASWVTGFKTTTVDLGVNPKKGSFKWRAREDWENMEKVRLDFRDGMIDYSNAEKRAKARFTDLVRKHEAMKTLDFSEDQIKKIMEEAGLPKYMQRNVMNKKYMGIRKEEKVWDRSESGGGVNIGGSDLGGGDLDTDFN